jgi:hypothetical protein
MPSAMTETEALASAIRCVVSWPDYQLTEKRLEAICGHLRRYGWELRPVDGQQSLEVVA